MKNHQKTWHLRIPPKTNEIATFWHPRTDPRIALDLQNHPKDPPGRSQDAPRALTQNDIKSSKVTQKLHARAWIVAKGLLGTIKSLGCKEVFSLPSENSTAELWSFSNSLTEKTFIQKVQKTPVVRNFHLSRIFLHSLKEQSMLLPLLTSNFFIWWLERHFRLDL